MKKDIYTYTDDSDGISSLEKLDGFPISNTPMFMSTFTALIVTLIQLTKMAFVVAGGVPWNDGEQRMHNLMRVPEADNPSVPTLSPGAAYLTQQAPLLALGTLDKDGRPWTTIWGGKPGFAGQFAQSTIGIRSLVDTTYDPVVQALLGGNADGELVKAEGGGKMVSGLAIDLEHRRRVKLYGRMVAGALEGLGSTGDFGQAQLAVNIEQSLGKYARYFYTYFSSPARA